MKQFQKIAIGLLGLTNPEMFIPRPKSGPAPMSTIGADRDGSPAVTARPRAGRGIRALRAVGFFFTALAIGSRTVPLADNSHLRLELRNSARLLHGADEV